MFVGLKQILLSIRTDKFSGDLFWNVIGFGVIAVCGFSINSFIAVKYDFKTLGYFNIVYALYILLSQISVWGVHLAIQRYIPQYSKLRHRIREFFTAGFILTLFFSSCTILVALIAHKLPGKLMNNQLLENGFVYAIPGLLFFGMNKCMLSYLNGMRFMKMFSFINALRAVLMVIFILIIYYNGIDVIYISLIYTIPEIILFVILIIIHFNLLKFSQFRNLVKTGKLLFRHANSVALGYILLDVNSKIDILVLGIFVESKLVGVYSFAAFVYEGFLQIFYVFRTNINPIITKVYFGYSTEVFKRIFKKSIKRFYLFFSASGIILLFTYPIALHLFKITDLFYENMGVFSILLTGVLISSGYIPFQMVFNQIGKPKVQTQFLVYMFLINLVLNFAFIPFAGIYGAAAAIFVSFVYQIHFIRNRLTGKDGRKCLA